MQHLSYCKADNREGLLSTLVQDHDVAVPTFMNSECPPLIALICKAGLPIWFPKLVERQGTAPAVAIKGFRGCFQVFLLLKPFVQFIGFMNFVRTWSRNHEQFTIHFFPSIEKLQNPSGASRKFKIVLNFLPISLNLRGYVRRENYLKKLLKSFWKSRFITQGFWKPGDCDLKCRKPRNYWCCLTGSR